MPDSFKKLLETGLQDSPELSPRGDDDTKKSGKIKKQPTVIVKSLKEEEDKIIMDILDEIWNTYNTDRNEYLDKNEMAAFIYITLIETGSRNYDSLE